MEEKSKTKVAAKTALFMVEELTVTLGVSRAALAALLLVSERTLSDWSTRPHVALPEKASRLLRLYSVVGELDRLMKLPITNNIPPEVAASLRALSVLHNGRIPLEVPPAETGKGGDGEGGGGEGGGGEDGASISLIGYVCACPQDVGWRANVKEALRDYLDYVAVVWPRWRKQSEISSI